ncbi:MAG: hypothetical protein JXA36_06240 [Coriobacteriia bacterium]|nr:hypothetical protein [Coriobacteriia bacterium]
MSENTRYGFPLEVWEAAKAQANLLLEERARVRGTLTYAELCREVTAVDLKPRSWAIMGFLNEICTEADAVHGIMLASLVVRADTGMPGEGYFRNAARLGRDVSDPEGYWRSEVERIYDVFAPER